MTHGTVGQAGSRDGIARSGGAYAPSVESRRSRSCGGLDSEHPSNVGRIMSGEGFPAGSNDTVWEWVEGECVVCEVPGRRRVG